jgi:DNA-binding MarR family transcriptional regulator
VTRAPDREDRRQRRLWLTEQGRQLDEELDGRLRRRLAGAYRAAGAEAVAGYHKVLLGLVDERARRLMRNAG